MDVDNLVLTNQGAPVFPIFGNTNTIPIPSQQGGAGSTIAVAGLIGGVSRVTVTLSNLSYPTPHSLSILLRSPSGQNVMLMSGAGGDNDILNVRLTFDDSAVALLPQNNPIASGTYRPAYYPPEVVLPGSPPPYATNLSALNGGNPNGNWSLFIYNNSFNLDPGSLRDRKSVV